MDGWNIVLYMKVQLSYTIVVNVAFLPGPAHHGTICFFLKQEKLITLTLSFAPIPSGLVRFDIPTNICTHSNPAHSVITIFF